MTKPDEIFNRIFKRVISLTNDNPTLSSKRYVIQAVAEEISVLHERIGIMDEKVDKLEKRIDRIDEILSLENVLERAATKALKEKEE